MKEEGNCPRPDATAQKEWERRRLCSGGGGDRGGKGRASAEQSRAEQRGCRGGSGGPVIRAEIDVKGRHRRQRESIKREDHIRGDRESFKLQGCCDHGGGVGVWKEGALEPREGGEF